jgi:hypothetical protein
VRPRAGLDLRVYRLGSEIDPLVLLAWAMTLLAPVRGVDGLRSLLHGDLPTIAYSHELTASVDATTFLVICIAFPLLALAVTARLPVG